MNKKNKKKKGRYNYMEIFVNLYGQILLFISFLFVNQLIKTYCNEIAYGFFLAISLIVVLVELFGPSLEDLDDFKNQK